MNDTISAILQQRSISCKGIQKKGKNSGPSADLTINGIRENNGKRLTFLDERSHVQKIKRNVVKFWQHKSG